METMIHEYILNIAMLVLTSVFTWAGKKLADVLNSKKIVSELQNHKELVSMVVHGVEQAYKTLGGKEKLDMAKIEVIKLAKTRGINISEGELDMFIESAVKDMNGITKQVEDVMETPAKIEASQPVQP